MAIFSVGNLMMIITWLHWHKSMTVHLLTQTQNWAIGMPGKWSKMIWPCQAWWIYQLLVSSPASLLFDVPKHRIGSHSKNFQTDGRCLLDLLHVKWHKEPKCGYRILIMCKMTIETVQTGYTYRAMMLQHRLFELFHLDSMWSRCPAKRVLRVLRAHRKVFCWALLDFVWLRPGPKMFFFVKWSRTTFYWMWNCVNIEICVIPVVKVDEMYWFHCNWQPFDFLELSAIFSIVYWSIALFQR